MNSYTYESHNHPMQSTKLALP